MTLAKWIPHFQIRFDSGTRLWSRKCPKGGHIHQQPAGKSSIPSMYPYSKLGISGSCFETPQTKPFGLSIALSSTLLGPRRAIVVACGRLQWPTPSLLRLSACSTWRAVKGGGMVLTSWNTLSCVIIQEIKIQARPGLSHPPTHPSIYIYTPIFPDLHYSSLEISKEISTV